MQVCSENQEETHFRALEYIRQRAYSRPESPFFLVASYHHPHDPFHVTQELWDLYEGQPIAVPDLPENLDKSYSEMDRWVNEVHGVHQVNLLDLLPTLLDLAGVAANRLPADGRSLTPLLAGAEEPARTIFSEYHVEKVKAPSFMVRRGKYKYIYVHGHGRQLFDLAADPGEWHNLSGRPALAALEEALRNLILSQFDPEQLAAAGAESVQRRLVIKEALARNGIHWDYFPYFDASRQYVR